MVPSNSCLQRAPALTCEGGHPPSGPSTSQSFRHGPAGREGRGVFAFVLRFAGLPQTRTLAARPSPLCLLRKALRQGCALGAQQRPQGLAPVSQHSVVALRPGRREAVSIEAIWGPGARLCILLGMAGAASVVSARLAVRVCRAVNFNVTENCTAFCVYTILPHDTEGKSSVAVPAMTDAFACRSQASHCQSSACA